MLNLIYTTAGQRIKQIIKAYQSLLIKAKNSATALYLQLEMRTFPSGLMASPKTNYGKRYLSRQWVIANTGSVTVMAYRDSGSQIIDLVKDEIIMAGKYGKPLVIGVETGQSNEGKISPFLKGKRI